MLLSLTLLKGTDTKITQLYLADAALASGQRRHYLLQRLKAYFATIKRQNLSQTLRHQLPPPQIPQRGLFPVKGNVG